jgi:predicted amidohydrolase YtcJ
VSVDDGKIVFAGAMTDAMKLKGAETRSVDLGGKALMPGFIDGHAHVLQFGAQAVGATLLAPPDGTVNTIDDVVAKLKVFASGPDVGRTGWIFGTGYDDSLLGRHPTRDDLDKVSTELGKRADFVLLSDHPVAVDAMAINKILVLETIKDGSTVYARQ